MARDDIIRMAREAGVISTKIDGIERFAALVATASASVEREACARVAEDWDTDSADPRDVATAIRARSHQ